MKVTCIYVDDFIGFVSLEDKARSECWFFNSKKQGKVILDKKVVDLNERVFCKERIKKSSLPPVSEKKPLYIRGRIPEYLSLLALSGSMCASSGSPLSIFLKPKNNPRFYYLFLPPKEECNINASGLIGLCDKDGNDYVFVFYCKDKGQKIIDKYSEGINPREVELMKRFVNNCPLPERENILSIEISEPLACIINRGYIELYCEHKPPTG